MTSGHRSDVSRHTQARGHEDSSDNIMVSVIMVTGDSVVMCVSLSEPELGSAAPGQSREEEGVIALWDWRQQQRPSAASPDTLHSPLPTASSQSQPSLAKQQNGCRI